MRELDWRIHEYMGNDLTGWEWAGDTGNYIFSTINHGLDEIPHYSTTWEGAGLVMEACRQQDWEVSLNYYESLAGWIYSAGFSRGERYPYLTVTDSSAPLALAKAYISAMEER